MVGGLTVDGLVLESAEIGKQGGGDFEFALAVKGSLMLAVLRLCAI